MASWAEFEAAEPGLAVRVAARFDTHPHHVLGTLRRDGSPRLSGVNVHRGEGHLWVGSMPDAVKIGDMERDPRVTIHSAPLSEELDGGDAVVSGLAHRAGADMEARLLPEGRGGAVYLVDLRRVHLVEVKGEELVVTVWEPSSGLRIVRRQ